MTSTLTAGALDLTGERPRKLLNYVGGEWVEGAGKFTTLSHAVTGAPVAEASTEGVDFKAMVDYARRVGGPSLRKMTFHERALMLKAMAQYLGGRKEEFYTISAATGATKATRGSTSMAASEHSTCMRRRVVASCLTRRFTWTVQPKPSRRVGRSSDVMCASRSKAWPCTSTRSTSPCGG